MQYCHAKIVDSVTTRSNTAALIQKIFLTLGDCDLQSPGSWPRVSLEVMQAGDAVSLVTEHVSGVLFPVTWHVS